MSLLWTKGGGAGNHSSGFCPRWVFVEHGLGLRSAAAGAVPHPALEALPVGSSWPLCLLWAGDAAEELRAETLVGQIRAVLSFAANLPNGLSWSLELVSLVWRWKIVGI